MAEITLSLKICIALVKIGKTTPAKYIQTNIILLLKEITNNPGLKLKVFEYFQNLSIFFSFQRLFNQHLLLKVLFANFHAVQIKNQTYTFLQVSMNEVLFFQSSTSCRITETTK